jgi:hypothetical protein
LPVLVEGLADLQSAFRRAGITAEVGLRAGLRHLAEPVRTDAEGLALQEIKRIGQKWSRMRIGQNQSLVYVAPVQRGVKTKGRLQLARPNLANLLMDRAMEPALRQNEPQIEAGMERILDRVAAQFNQGGPL